MRACRQVVKRQASPFWKVNRREKTFLTSGMPAYRKGLVDGSRQEERHKPARSKEEKKKREKKKKEESF